MLSLDQVKAIADLARIEVPASDLPHLQGQLNGILAMVDRMREVDTTGVEPMAHPQAVSQRLREDHVAETDQHVLFQSVAPRTEDGLYLVPRVIE